MLCILISAWVLCTSFAGQNHLFHCFNIFSCHKLNGEKRKESANKKEKIHEKTEKGNPSAFRCYIRISAQNKMHELLNDNE